MLKQGCYLEGLLLEEGQRIRKDVQSFHSLPVGSVEVCVDGQVLIAQVENTEVKTRFIH